MTAPADPGPGNRWADCGTCVEVPTVTGWALGRQVRCPVHGQQPFPVAKQSGQLVRDPDEFTPDPADDWRPPQEMVEDLVEAWHTQPDQLLDDFMRDLLRRWAAAGRLVPEPTEIRTEWGVWWHANDDYDSICMSEDRIGCRARAEELGRQRIGEYRISRYTLRRREHRKFADGSTWIGPWLPEESGS